MNFLLPSFHDVVTIHAKLPVVADGIRDSAGLESALQRPSFLLAYTPDISLVQVAASMIESIAMAHAFIDGNKRTAVITGLLVLAMHTASIQSVSAALARQIEQAVMSHDWKALQLWLADHLCPLQDVVASITAPEVYEQSEISGTSRQAKRTIRSYAVIIESLLPNILEVFSADMLYLQNH